MEEFLKRAEELRQRIGRRKELQGFLEDADDRLYDLRRGIPELNLAVAQAEYDRKQAEEPGFFRRLLGNQEARLTKAQGAYRAAATELERANRSIRELEHRMEQARREEAELSDSWVDYIAFLEEHLPTVPEAQEMILDQYARDAIEISLRLTNTLQQARPGMRHDVMSDRVRYGDRKMELMAEADGYAEQFCTLLEKLPEGIVAIGASLRRPSDYIRAVTMENAQLDRLNNVMDDVWKARQKLREHFGIS